MITVKNKTKHRKYSIVCTSFFKAEGLYDYSCYLSPFPRPAAKDQFKSRKRNTGFPRRRRFIKSNQSPKQQ